MTHIPQHSTFIPFPSKRIPLYSTKMPFTLGVFNCKGGVGKTTISIATIATTNRVLVVEADPQMQHSTVF